MVLPVMFEGDARVETEEWWEKREETRFRWAPMGSSEEEE